MNTDLIETLLYQPESPSLDFKDAAYPFAGATEEQKGEMLKDILAFLNSWRLGDAYIVMGVRADSISAVPWRCSIC